MKNNSEMKHDIYVSSRIRLARNLCDYPFEPVLDKTGAEEIIDKVGGALSGEGYSATAISALAENDKRSLVEKHLISPEMAEKTTASAIIENDNEGIVIMVCEEDHLRIQALREGFDLEGAYAACMGVEEKLDEKLSFAYDEKLGYLTHCPTNLGTGMRASVMMFLPALTIAGKIRGITSRLQALGVCVRGINGEGSAARGCLYQFSNCTSLGMSEDEIIANLKKTVEKIEENERLLRDTLYKNNPDAMRDRVLRSYGIMKYAHVLSSEEMYKLYADVRLGICLGIIGEVDTATLDSLLISTLPATLSRDAGRDLTPSERDTLRAERVRQI